MIKQIIINSIKSDINQIQSTTLQNIEFTIQYKLRLYFIEKSSKTLG